MSRIEELIKEKCSNGVEYKRLKSICTEIIVPMRDRPKIFDGEIPWCRIEDIEGRYFNESLSGLKVSEEIIKEMNLKVFPAGTVICSCSASIGVYAINTQPLITNQTFIGLVCGDEIFNKFLLYYMETQTKTLLKLATTGTIPYISRNKFENLEIPVPPIEVQQEIVRILDKFTELEAELQAELDARKKQYEYYLDAYFDSQIKNLLPISKIGTLQRGKRFVHADTVENNGVACIHYGELYTHYGVYTNYARSHIREELRPKMRYAHKGDVIIVGAGENNIDIGVGVVWDGEEDVAVHDACYTLTHKQNSKYISYYLRSSFYHNQIKRFVCEGKICSISAEGIGRALIPIPSLEEQNRIVKIFDVFDAICNDKSLGLQAEILLRHKQYEYYRDKLLTFKRKVV